jgi:hypothetical protein
VFNFLNFYHGNNEDRKRFVFKKVLEKNSIKQKEKKNQHERDEKVDVGFLSGGHLRFSGFSAGAADRQ